jgi:hypothetical protein
MNIGYLLIPKILYDKEYKFIYTNVFILLYVHQIEYISFGEVYKISCSSDYFRKLKKGEKIPQYMPIVNKNNNNKIKVTFQEI